MRYRPGLWITVVCLLLFTGAAHAQDLVNPKTVVVGSRTTFSGFLLSPSHLTTTETESVLDTLKRLRGKYGTLTPQTAAALLNETAWLHRSEGVVLLGKKSGSNCPQPKTGVLISCDYLVDSNTKKGADVLVAWDAAGTPTFSGFNDDLSSALANGSRTLVNPVDPGTTPPPSKPPASGALTKADLNAAVAAIEAHDDANTAKVQQQIDQVVHNAENTGRSLWKWLGPLLAGLGTTAGVLVH